MSIFVLASYPLQHLLDGAKICVSTSAVQHKERLLSPIVHEGIDGKQWQLHTLPQARMV